MENLDFANIHSLHSTKTIKDTHTVVMPLSIIWRSLHQNIFTNGEDGSKIVLGLEVDLLSIKVTLNIYRANDLWMFKIQFSSNLVSEV